MALSAAVNGGIHWLGPDGAACGVKDTERSTPAMGGVTCRHCRDIIDLEIDTLAGGVAPPAGREAPAMSPAVREALDAINEELRGFRVIR